jgi:hypothetical protein
MRLKLAVIVMLGLPAMAAAQPAVSVPGGVVPLPPIGLPLPQIGLPLPQIGLPLPPIGLPPAAASPRHSAVNGPTPGVRRQHRSVIYFIPAYGWPYPYEAPTASATPVLPDGSPAPPKPQPLHGRLRLDIEPGGAGAQQIYVDSYYVGTLEDFSGEVELEAGPHTIEIQAPGYETLHIDVMIADGRSITYRGTLKTTDAKPAPEAAAPSSTSTTPATPLTLYYIPGCYIGNVLPQDAGLPASCDLSRVVTIKK